MIKNKYEFKNGKFFLYAFMAILIIFLSSLNFAYGGEMLTKKEKREKQLKELQTRFEWWPTDAKPAPVKDEQRGGYWWWPDQPGQARPWGNRGYVYVYKIIYDYTAPDEEEEIVEPPKEEEPKQPVMKPSLLVKKIIKNVKIYGSSEFFVGKLPIF